MTEPIRSMAELVNALRARRDELDISHETIDAIAGLQSGYASKLLAPRAPRNIGYMSLGDIMGALGVGLHVVEDSEQIQRVAGRWQKRKPQGPRYNAASSGPSKRIEVSEIIGEDDLFAGRNRMQILGRKGGQVSGKIRGLKASRKKELRLKRAEAARRRWAPDGQHYSIKKGRAKHSAVTRRKRLSQARKQGRHTKQQWLALMAACRHVCVRCGASDRQLVKDHILPLYQGGSDGIENLQPICAPCNGSKGPECIDYRPKDWMGALLSLPRSPQSPHDNSQATIP